MSFSKEPPRDVFDAGGRGLQHHGLRRSNERAVLTVVGFNPGVSNAEIARISGLAPQTVSAILSDVERAGLIERGPVLRGRRGQPATPIFLRAEGAYAVGVEIGWRHAEVVLIDLHARVLGQRRFDHAFPDAHRLLEAIAEQVEALRQELDAARRGRLRDLGIAMPSNMAAHLDLVGAPPEQAELWAGLDIAGRLQALTGLDVSIFNDGNAACWAELIAHPRPRPANFIYFLISHYIAAGIVGEGVLWEGPNGNSANLGSMLVPAGAEGMQLAHGIASVAALSERLAAAGQSQAETDPARWDWQAIAPVVDGWLADSARTLARVIFNTTNVLETGLVVLDTILPNDITERLVAGVTRELQTLAIRAYRPPPVAAGHVGRHAPAVGAAELPLYRRHFSRTGPE